MILRKLVLRRHISRHAGNTYSSISDSRVRPRYGVLLGATVLFASFHGRQSFLVDRLVLLDCPPIIGIVWSVLGLVRLANVMRRAIVAMQFLVCPVVPILTGLVSVYLLCLRHAAARN